MREKHPPHRVGHGMIAGDCNYHPRLPDLDRSHWEDLLLLNEWREFERAVDEHYSRFLRNRGNPHDAIIVKAMQLVRRIRRGY